MQRNVKPSTSPDRAIELIEPVRLAHREKVYSAAAAAAFAARAIHKATAMIISVTTAMVSVASTLISGLTPRRTFENTTMGNVLLPGPDVKLEITRSSHDRVKASSHPDRMAGKMMGSVMTKNIFKGRAPKSIAASSSAVSKLAK